MKLSKLAFVLKRDFFEKCYSAAKENDVGIYIKTDAEMFKIIEEETEDGKFYGLMDRNLCETDDNYLQVIPYITLMDRVTGNIFVYTRGEKGDESRLHGKCSVGIGGHIDNSITTTFVDLVLQETIREIKEEVGYDFDDNDVIKLKESIENESHFIYSENDDVSLVHIGLSVVFDVDVSKLNNFEDGVITKGLWMDPESLYDTDLPFTLEDWSKLSLELLYN